MNIFFVYILASHNQYAIATAVSFGFYHIVAGPKGLTVKCPATARTL